MRTLVSLKTPPALRIAPDGVFDAFGWCESDRLGWGRPPGLPLDLSPVTAANPPGMVFVMHGDEAAFLPRELGALHVPAGMALTDEWALAPWAIDDATDLLYERRARPRDLLWLATGSIAGLFWGLHDWAHFHNHGPFERRAWTELQCDATALAWLWANRAAIGLREEAWEAVRREVMALSGERFASEGKGEGEGESPFDPAWLDADRVRALVTRSA